MSHSKPRVIKDFENLDPVIQEQIKLVYPHGFSEHLIYFKNKDGVEVSALPFETDDKYYMVRMTKIEAVRLIEDDDDFDEDGNLHDDIKDDLEDKYSDVDYIDDQTPDF